MFEVELTNDRMSVGRNDDNDIAIPDGSVSGSHGQFAHDGGTWTFSDLGSTNGTKVNGLRIDGERVLVDGDIISLGSSHLRFEASNASA